jgi:ABC-type bacteriocin/lantibiotic exporter with double-glycine peptidase domain
MICALSYPQAWYFMYGIPFTGSFYRAFLWWFGPQKSHYVVAFGLGTDEVLFMDPAFGFATMSWERFKTCWGAKEYAALICSI